MARRPIEAVAGDFSDVVALLQGRGIVPAIPSAELLGIAECIHGYTYSLILWRFRLRGLPYHGKVFIEEIASDALQILPQVLMGYSKTAKLLIRGIAENTLRHIYFFDHPIEFERMNRDKKWFLSVEQLCEYAKNHPRFWGIEPKFDAINRLSALYSELSAGVHGRAVRDLEMRAALRKIVYDEASSVVDSELLRRCAESTNFLLAIFHREKVRMLRGEDRRIIMRTMPPKARQLWTEQG